MPDVTKNDMLYGVCCDAANCKFHGYDNRCCADNIVVESPSAQRKAETYCGTFSPKVTSD